MSFVFHLEETFAKDEMLSAFRPANNVISISQLQTTVICKFVAVLYDILLKVFLIDILLASWMVVRLGGLKCKVVNK